jgi:muramoyltetrapeptide carboxypeptidase
MPLIRPPALKRGDKAALVAPAGPVSSKGLSKARRAIEALGLKAEVFGDLTSRFRYLSASDESRARALHEAFVEPTVKAIFSLRGGYGTTRILPLLDFELIEANPTIFVGSSDVTALLAALVQEAGLVAFHGPPAAEGLFGASGAPLLKSFWYLAGEPKPLGEVRPQGLRALRSGRARGRLTGGCLSLIAATVGTGWQLQARGAVLFLEDVGEAAYRIDRMLTQLSQAGVLDGVAAVLVGEMVDCQVPKGEDWSLDDVMLDRLGHLEIPILAGFPSGHGRNEVVLPMGVEVEVDAEVGCLTICEAAVA